MTRKAKYAPPNEDGLKPWVVTLTSWGRSTEHLVYAKTNAAACYAIKGRQMYCSAKGVRATPEDVACLGRARS